MRFSTKDERAMRLALDKAHSALLAGEIPVGCVIVDPASPDVPLIATHNEVEKQGNLTAHAEILALSRVDRRRLKGSTMYVTLEPCPMCAGALALSGVKRVVYGASDPQYGCCGSVYRLTEDPAFPNFCRADGGLLSKECEQLLKQAFDGLRGRSPGQ